MNIRATIFALVASGATLTAATGPAFAQDQTSVAVSYRDLNLNSAQGRSTLDQRIRSAARRVCGPQNGAGLSEMQNRIECRANAVRQAQSQTSRISG